ncbi:MAG: polyprenol monophosphomannose synthase [Gemmataceae bacterium]
MGETLRQSEATDLSVIVPTFREADNLPLLVPRLTDALARAGLVGEILVVDDDSPDDTVAVCADLAGRYPVRLLVRKGERGLATAVLHGMRQARGRILVVMDADLSHPPEQVPELYALVANGQADFALGSRFVPAGSVAADWGFYRRANALIARLLARPLARLHDPLSGFFALPRSAFAAAVDLNPVGYKIGLELLVKTAPRRIREVPVHFADRARGSSKMTWREQLNYLRHLAQLYGYRLRRLLGR